MPIIYVMQNKYAIRPYYMYRLYVFVTFPEVSLHVVNDILNYQCHAEQYLYNVWIQWTVLMGKMSCV